MKIAECVKELMRRKEISKIRIGDVMNETGMSRQSFYYHFQDIYEVMEWIGSDALILRNSLRGKATTPCVTHL